MIGVSEYQGGRLWAENISPLEPGNPESGVFEALPNGEQRRGHWLATQHQVAHFPPKAWHGPESWKGRRNTVCLYVSRGHGLVGSDVRKELQNCGFRLPRRSDSALANDTPSVGSRAQVPIRPLQSETQRQARIKKQLYLLHAATGHGSVRSLVEVLKRRNASEEVLQLARDFKCSVCQERCRVKPRHLASLEALPPKWHTLSADLGHWKHPQTGEHVQFLLLIDEGSRFRVAKILSKGSKQQPNTATCIQYIREGWAQYFGMPRTLRLDPAGALRSQGIIDFCDKENIFLDNIPADAHWQIGVCEQAIQGVKSVLDKLCADDPELTPEVVLTMAISVFNHRDQIRGFSPVQHAFGRAPDVTGRLVETSQPIPDDRIIENPSEEFEASARLRAEAEKAHAEWHAGQRISRALNSRPRPPADYSPGDLIYFLAVAGVRTRT